MHKIHVVLCNVSLIGGGVGGGQLIGRIFERRGGGGGGPWFSQI